ncbi:uncharacterized protein BCR38DRAFT_500497 [Pseudomassariella vexata]|uniref:MYND-type domain-containing protein n=1 Tax=Pseudomassariella vexata TaxID=1141098 RepID=A0A1Y2DH45_9PEZI|nr:uncharacterized protein BCR38DRAFT_500497 [Pseudomassariella vexata]ORY58572.1 hypothetical protein BCR38DRAFT_500497 [Pseudomassariella vexata]
MTFPSSCLICLNPTANLCARCKSTSYCSRACQLSDWPSHKLLCSAFPKQLPRPSAKYQLAILFSPEQDKPALVWAPRTSIPTRWTDGNYASIVQNWNSKLNKLLELDGKEVSGTKFFIWNARLAKPLQRTLVVFHCNSSLLSMSALSPKRLFESHRSSGQSDGKSKNTTTSRTKKCQSFLTTFQSHPSGPHRPLRWYPGPSLLAAYDPNGSAVDITLSDLRHAIDSIHDTDFSWAGSSLAPSLTSLKAYLRIQGEEPRILEAPRRRLISVEESIAAVRVHGTKGLLQEGHAVCPVSIVAEHPIRNGGGAASLVSSLLGIPLRIRKHGDNDTKDEKNHYAASLMLDLDPSSPTWGTIPAEWNEGVGDILLVSNTDSTSLSGTELCKAVGVCGFVNDMVLPRVRNALLKMLEEDEKTGQEAKDEVMRFVNARSFHKYLARWTNEFVDYGDEECAGSAGREVLPLGVRMMTSVAKKRMDGNS